MVQMRYVITLLKTFKKALYVKKSFCTKRAEVIQIDVSFTHFCYIPQKGSVLDFTLLKK